jgi:osmotically-inducible protein OsmY
VAYRLHAGQWGPLLAASLGVAPLGSLSVAGALAAAPTGQVKDEVVVTATRESDAVLAAKVTAAVQQDPYVFGDHITVTVENGVVRLDGIVDDLSDLHRVLRLARRIAGKRSIANYLELMPLSADHD